LLYHQLNVNKCTCFSPSCFHPHQFSPSYGYPLTIWKFMSSPCPLVPYLRIASRFFSRKYSESYFLETRSDLSQNDSSGCNKMLKEATSHASSMKISLMYSLGVLSCPKTFFTAEILYPANAMRTIDIRHKYRSNVLFVKSVSAFVSN